MTAPVKVKLSELTGAGGWVVDDVRSGGVGPSVLMAPATLPTAFVDSVVAEEIANGYSSEYRALAVNKRAQKKPVWVSDNGVSIGAGPVAQHGVSRFDAMLGYYASKHVDGRAIEMMDYFANLSALPAPMWDGTPGQSIAFDTEKAAELMNAVFGTSLVPTDITSSVIQAGGLASGDTAHVHQTAWLAARSASELALGFIVQATNKTADPTTDMYTLHNAYFLQIVANKGSSVALCPHVVFSCYRNRALPDWITRGDFGSYYCTLSALAAPTPLVDSVYKAGVTLNFATDAQYSLPAYSGCAGTAYVIHHALPGTAETGFTAYAGGKFRHANMYVWNFPPIADAIHIVGPTSRDVASRIIGIDQKLVAMEWSGKAVASLHDTLTPTEVADLGRMYVRTSMKMDGQWVTPPDCIVDLELYADAQEASFELKDEVWCPADAAKGQEQLTFGQASIRGSNKRVGMIHQVLVGGDALPRVRVTYAGSLVGGFTYTAEYVDGSTPDFTSESVRLAVLEGCDEVNSTTDSATVPALRLALFDITASDMLDFKEKSKKASRDLDERSMFRGAAPDLSFLPANQKAGFSMLSYSPPRDNLNGMVAGAYTILRTLGKRLNRSA